MIEFQELGNAFQLLAEWPPWVAVIPGLIIGLIFGSVPGLSIALGIAVFLPATLYMDVMTALIFLTAIFTGGGFGCAIPAILMSVPGSTAAIPTTFDGFPMTRKGMHNEALGLALGASCLGCAAGYLVLLVGMGPLASLVTRLGPAEMLMIALAGLTLIGVFRSSGGIIKGIFAGVLGLVIGTFGVGPTGMVRGTFGSAELLNGIPSLPAMIGLFVSSELFKQLRATHLVSDPTLRVISIGRIWRGAVSAVKYPGTLVRGSLFGGVIGAVPGIGGSIATLISYNMARRSGWRKPKDAPFGEGNPVGVVASEAADNGSEAGSLATLLALGVPGSIGTAAMLGALSLHGVTGGPRFVNENMDVVYAVILANLGQVLILFGVGAGFCYAAAFVTKVRLQLLVPIVLVVATFGAFSVTRSLMGPLVLMIFTVLGFVMSRYGYPVMATIIGLVLSGLVEGSLIRTYQISGGGELRYFLGRPVFLILVGIVVATIVVAVVRRRKPRSVDDPTEMLEEDESRST